MRDYILGEQAWVWNAGAEKQRLGENIKSSKHSLLSIKSRKGAFDVEISIYN